MSNWRYNPFAETQAVTLISETKTIEWILELQKYGFWLREAPKKSDGVIVALADPPNSTFAEVDFLTAPDGWEFRVDYGPRGTNSALMEFNFTNDGDSVFVTYRGVGTAATYDGLAYSLSTV